MNNINITGRLTKDPERKTSNSGKSVTSVNLAVKRPFTKDTTDFLTVVLWEKKCDYICQYGHKGDIVAVSGMLTTRSWQDSHGNDRISHEIVANNVEIVGGKKPVQNTEQASNITQLPQYPAQQEFVQNPQEFEIILTDEDLPF